jgi:tRNA (cmo5U34)-methyltransferase
MGLPCRPDPAAAGSAWYNRDMNKWTSADHALAYLARADRIPHRTEGEAVLLEIVPTTVSRILDLGTGNGRLLALLKIDRPHASAVALDFSPLMLQTARERFKDNPTVEIVEHDLDQPLPALGRFGAVVSSFAIHHLADARKRALYAEVFDILESGGVFGNLEHVSSPTPRLQEQFRRALGTEPPDPSNKLLDVATQLRWLDEIGFQDVDCLWKWRELALLAAVRP